MREREKETKRERERETEKEKEKEREREREKEKKKNERKRERDKARERERERDTTVSKKGMTVPKTGTRVHSPKPPFYKPPLLVSSRILKQARDRSDVGFGGWGIPISKKHGGYRVFSTSAPTSKPYF